MAGLYNKVRTEGAAKGLRDDHVALNLVCISYSMLHTTAVALGDAETASLAKRSLIECSKFVTEIDALVPSIGSELQDGDFGAGHGAVEQTRADYSRRTACERDERSSESARATIIAPLGLEWRCDASGREAMRRSRMPASLARTDTRWAGGHGYMAGPRSRAQIRCHPADLFRGV